MSIISAVAPATAGLDEKALSSLDASVQSDIDSGRNYGSSILVARGGKIGHRRTFGTAAPNRPIADDDRFLQMSLSKSFTAALVLRAIDQGRFTLDTRIADLLPAFAAGGKQRVTVRMLLTHTGGTFGGVVPPPPLPLAAIGDLEKLTAAVSAVPAAFVPGTRCQYNPFASISVLGQLLVLTDPAKRRFRDITREDLFEPLGMTDSCFGIPADDFRRVPVSQADAVRSPHFATTIQLLDASSLGEAELPAGGAHSTVDDVFRFAEAMRRGGRSEDYRVISRALFDYAARNHTGSLPNDAMVSAVEAEQRPPLRANFSLLGGYARDEGHFLSPLGFTASPRAIGAVGGGTTMWMVDPARDLTFVFLSAGFIEGLPHFDRLSRLADLALSACVD